MHLVSLCRTQQYILLNEPYLCFVILALFLGAFQPFMAMFSCLHIHIFICNLFNYIYIYIYIYIYKDLNGEMPVVFSNHKRKSY
jgi:hypothetical protein